jgi:signal transduction histidine kinase
VRPGGRASSGWLKGLMPEVPPARILIVDDEAPLMKALCETLRDEGYETTGFTSAKEALIALKDREFDLLMTDLTMSEMDGVGLVRAALEGNDHLVAIVMTGQGTIGTAVAAMKAGALDYILKPFNLTVILPVLARALDVGRLRKENVHLREALRISELRRKNFELEEQSRRVQEANRLKSEFLANMSHELRTPLNGIIGFSEFLVDGKPGPLNAKQKEYLNDVLCSGRHLLQLINDILDLSKVEAGKMQLHLETFSLIQVAHEVCAGIKPMASEKNITVRVDLDPALDRVTLDEQKLKQIVYNLMSNAVKFTDQGGTVTIKAGLLARERFQIEVRDTGIGIGKEDLGKLFREFVQLDSGAGRRHAGTGLGLALTKKMVEFQEGSIRVESELGRGTAFIVELPVTLMADKV